MMSRLNLTNKKKLCEGPYQLSTVHGLFFVSQCLSSRANTPAGWHPWRQLVTMPKCETDAPQPTHIHRRIHLLLPEPLILFLILTEQHCPGSQWKINTFFERTWEIMVRDIQGKVERMGRQMCAGTHIWVVSVGDWKAENPCSGNNTANKSQSKHCLHPLGPLPVEKALVLFHWCTTVMGKPFMSKSLFGFGKHVRCSTLWRCDKTDSLMVHLPIAMQFSISKFPCDCLLVFHLPFNL